MSDRQTGYLPFREPVFKAAHSITTLTQDRDGLDLARTKPPIGEIIKEFERVYRDNPILYVIEVHERLVLEPLAALRATFEDSEIHIYDIAGPTGRHGVLVGTHRWQA